MGPLRVPHVVQTLSELSCLIIVFEVKGQSTTFLEAESQTNSNK